MTDTERLIADGKKAALSAAHDDCLLIADLVDALERQQAVVEAFRGAAEELKRFGAPGTIGCWCNAGKPNHSPGCKAMQFAVRVALDAPPEGEG